MSASRVLVIGLDGVPLTLVEPWIAAGHLPNMAKLTTAGAVGLLRSTIPPTSGPAWSSFATGKGPGKTNIYDFLYRQSGTYSFPPVNASRRDGKSLWRILSEHGKRVGVVNVPISYPVEPVDGFLVSGWLTPYTAKDFTYPSSLFQELRDHVGDYHIYPQETFDERSRDAYLAASARFLERTLEANLYLMRRSAWDFYMTVVFDTDRVLHQMWHYLDPSHPWRKDRDDLSGQVLGYFKQVDDAVGRMVREAGDDALTILMSDHGMGAAHYFILLNLWLLQEGLLVLKNGALTRLKRALFDLGFHLVNIHKVANRLGLSKHAEYKAGYFTDRILKEVFLSFNDVDWSRSKAYSYGRHLGNVYLNVRGREPHGIVEPGSEYEEVRAEIAERARRFVHPYTRAPVVGEVLRREDVYHGPHLDEAPDLILVQRDPRDIFFGLSDFGSNAIAQPVYRYSGMHRDHGLLVAHGTGVQPGTVHGAEIVDLAPTILYAMGIPVPRDMDGKVLTELFRSDNGWGEVAYTDELAAIARAPELVYTGQQEDEVKKRLKGMGYL